MKSIMMFIMYAASLQGNNAPIKLWQLSVFAYNISVIIRQKKFRFKQQEYRTFIDRFISVPAKIIRSGHKIEIKLYEHHFYKADWEELDRLIAAA